MVLAHTFWGSKLGHLNCFGLSHTSVKEHNTLVVDPIGEPKGSVLCFLILHNVGDLVPLAVAFHRIGEWILVCTCCGNKATSKQK